MLGKNLDLIFGLIVSEKSVKYLGKPKGLVSGPGLGYMTKLVQGTESPMLKTTRTWVQTFHDDCKLLVFLSIF